jgi:hypothetical protein
MQFCSDRPTSTAQIRIFSAWGVQGLRICETWDFAATLIINPKAQRVLWTVLKNCKIVGVEHPDTGPEHARICKAFAAGEDYGVEDELNAGAAVSGAVITVG